MIRNSFSCIFAASLYKALATKEGGKSILGFFGSGFKLDPTVALLLPKEREERIARLHQRLVGDEDLLFRGTEGDGEIIHAASSGYLGFSPAESKKDDNHDIVGFIRDNDSRYFLSCTPCPQTAKPYAAGLSLFPARGYVATTAYPKVYTRPQLLLGLNPEMFEAWDQRFMAAQEPEDRLKFQSITTMAASNNEITAVHGAEVIDDWRLELKRDVSTITRVCGPGRLYGRFMGANELVHIEEWINPDFQKRIYALEVFFYSTEEELAKMNERACELGILPQDRRLMTLEDARAVVNSGHLDKLNQEQGMDTTMKFTHVPKEIAIGEEKSLTEFMLSELQATNRLQPREEESSEFGMGA